MKKFIEDLGVVPSIQDPLEIFCDNEGAIALAKEPRSHQRTRHIHRRFNYIGMKLEVVTFVFAKYTLIKTW